MGVFPTVLVLENADLDIHCADVFSERGKFGEFYGFYGNGEKG
jgi:hypothetical protein